MVPNLEKRIWNFKVALMVLSLLAFCTGTGSMVLHYINGFLMSSSNALTNCLTVPTTAFKYQNTSTLLLVVTAAIGAGILFSLLLALITIIWFAKKDLSQQTASRNRPLLYIITALALLTTAVGGGYYLQFLMDYNNYSCGATVQQACLIQAVLLGVGFLSLVGCIIVTLLLPKKEKAAKLYQANKERHQPKQNQFEPTNRPLNRNIPDQPPKLEDGHHYKILKGERKDEGIYRMQDIQGGQPDKNRTPTNKEKGDHQSTKNGSIRAQQTVYDPSQHSHKPPTLNELPQDPLNQLTAQLMNKAQRQTPASQTKQKLHEPESYEPLLPFMAYRPNIQFKINSFSSSISPKHQPIDPISFRPKQPVWEYPQIPFDKLQEPSMEKSVVPKVLKEQPKPIVSIPQGAFQRRQKMDARLQELVGLKSKDSKSKISISPSREEPSTYPVNGMLNVKQKSGQKARTFMQNELKQKYGFV